MLGAHLAGEVHHLEESRHLRQVVEFTHEEFEDRFRLEIHIWELRVCQLFVKAKRLDEIVKKLIVFRKKEEI